MLRSRHCLPGPLGVWFDPAWCSCQFDGSCIKNIYLELPITPHEGNAPSHLRTSQCGQRQTSSLVCVGDSFFFPLTSRETQWHNTRLRESAKCQLLWHTTLSKCRGGTETRGDKQGLSSSTREITVTALQLYPASLESPKHNPTLETCPAITWNQKPNKNYLLCSHLISKSSWLFLL